MYDQRFFLLLLPFLFLPLFGEPTPVQAQTPVAKIEASDGDSVLTSFNDGGFAVFGNHGTGTIPAEGDGTRLMWYPAKSAFRAGQVSSSFGDEWNDANVGGYSVAFGSSTEASGNGSVATGSGSIAGGNQSVAMGLLSEATGDKSVALGNIPKATGDRSVAMGQLTQANGNNSTAFGRETVADGPNSVAMGSGTSATAGASFAMGLNTTASARRTTALGNGTTADGPQATALGYQTTASGGASTAMGNGTTASSAQAVAMGNGTSASGDHSTAMGNSTTASGNQSLAVGQGSFATGTRTSAMGTDVEAIGNGSTALGWNTIAQNNRSVSIGQFNDANSDPSSTANVLFVAGNGSPSGRSDALVLYRSGSMILSGILADESDRRLKKNIKSLGAGILDTLRQIRPVRFHFKDSTSHPAGPQIGLIAQDVQVHFPELVRTGPDGYLSLSYSRLTAVLLKGIQEQQATIDSQQKQIDRLDAKMKNMSARVAKLEREQNPSIAALPESPWTLGGLLLLACSLFVWERRKTTLSVPEDREGK